MTFLPLGSEHGPQIPHHQGRVGVWGVPCPAPCPLPPAPCPCPALLPRCPPCPLPPPLPPAPCPLPPALSLPPPCPLPLHPAPCPVPCPPCVSTSSSPDRARGPGCLLVACCSPSGRHRPRRPTTRHQPISVTFGRLYIELRQGAESKKASLEGGLGVNPKP